MYFYPKKFPEIVPYYETKAHELFDNPDKFKKFVQESIADIYPRFEKIKKEYDENQQKDLDFLLRIDAKLQKLYAFRFWVINYLFADGPLHEYYVDQVRSFVPYLIQDELGFEEYEEELALIERNLLQSEHTDLYLENALKSVELLELMKEKDLGLKLVEEIVNLLNSDDNDMTSLSPDMDKLIDEILEPTDQWSKAVAECMSLQISQALFRKTREPIYQMLVQAVEFEEENKKLKNRQASVSEEVNKLLDKAKNTLDPDDFKDFYRSYLMSSELAKTKDIMGNVDPIILPFWFDLLDEIGDSIPNYSKTIVGPGAVFYEFVWHVSAEQKAFIYTPDSSDLT